MPPRPDVAVTRFSFGGQSHVLLSFPVAPRTVTARLTLGERQVAELVVSGQSNAQIAETRGTSARTAANQLAAIYKKLGISSRRELIALCSPRRR